jgi:ATP-binding cassette subfamily C protein
MYRYITKNRGLYALYAVFLIISSTMSVFFAFVLSEILNCAVEGNLGKLQKVLVFGIIFLIAAVLSEFLYGVVKNRLVCLARLDLKRDLFDCILHRKTTDFESRNTGDYMNELLNNLNMYESLYFENILQIPMIVFSFLVAVLTCIYIQPVMLVLILVIGFFTALLVKHTGKRLEKSTGIFAEQSAAYSGEIKDDFSGYRTICANFLFETISKKHGLANRRMERSKETNMDDRTIFMCLNELAGLASTIVIMALAAYFSIKGNFSVGIVLAFGQLAGKIISPIMSASDTWVQFQSSKKLTENYRAILAEGEAKAAPLLAGHSASSQTQTAHSGEGATSAMPQASHTGKTATGAMLASGDIKLNDVSLSLGEKTVLNHVTLTFEKGKKYLVTGESGAGKSTLLHVISGLYDEYQGELTIGGCDLKTAPKGALSRLVSLASQEVFLFNDTIRNNITLFEHYSDESIQTVLHQCGLEELVGRLPDGIDTVISENGSNFSGGEKQRINLARALIRDCEILLLDEVSANLDPETTDFIERTVLGLDGKTVISVSHKMPEKLAAMYDEVIQVS